MSSQLTERDWTSLLRRIRDGYCTPFLGAGACYPSLPLGSTIAREWAQEYSYPLEDKGDLVRVAQFLAVQNDPMYPKDEFLDKVLSNVTPPDFFQADEPHGLLADLPLPIYMTTNYDNFMVRALQTRAKTPHRELLPWNKYIGEQQSVFDDASGFEPTADEPVVFHLHGHDGVRESLVLAEGDYLDFLVNVSRDPTLIPARIQRALGGTSLLFIGYSLRDWSFRVLFQGVIRATADSLRRSSVTVQLPPDESSSSEQKKEHPAEPSPPDREETLSAEPSPPSREDTPPAEPSPPGQKNTSPAERTDSEKPTARQYLDEYYDRMDIRVYWGTAREFSAELRRRWEAFPK